MKNLIIFIVLVVVVAGAAYLYFGSRKPDPGFHPARNLSAQAPDITQ